MNVPEVVLRFPTFFFFLPLSKILRWTWVFFFWSKVTAGRLSLQLMRFWGFWVDWAHLELDMGSGLILWHKSSASWSDSPSSPLDSYLQQPGRVEGPLYRTGTSAEPLATAGHLPLICFDSTSSSGIFTALMIQSCQLTQLRENVNDGFMVCGSGFMTHGWKSRCLWNKISHCSKKGREGPTLYSKNTTHSNTSLKFKNSVTP